MLRRIEVGQIYSMTGFYAVGQFNQAIEPTYEFVKPSERWQPERRFVSNFAMGVPKNKIVYLQQLVIFRGWRCV